jgi:hypothetical protein
VQSLLLFQKRGGSTADGQIVAAIVVSNNPHCGMSSVEIRSTGNAVRRGASYRPAKYGSGMRNKARPGNQKPGKEKSGKKGAGNKKARRRPGF